MLLQPGIPTSFTFTIGWVDVVILAILVVAFLRGRRLFFPMLALVVILYIFRIFPNEILAMIRGINQLNGPAAA